MLIRWTHTDRNTYTSQFAGRSIVVKLDSLGWRVIINNDLIERVFATERCAMGEMESAAQAYYIAQANKEFKEKYGM